MSFTSLLNLFFPPTCRHCGQDGVWLCQRCLSMAQPIDRRRPLASLDRLCCLGSYDLPVLATSIQQLKYTGGQVLAEPLARALAQRFNTTLTADIIVPVPLHASRQRERGFNQAELLARVLGQRLRIPVERAVKRIRRTTPQVTLNEAQRKRNVVDAFAPASSLEITAKRGIIVDDVFTTGATIAEVARVLHAAGMKQITAVTVAKG